MHHLLLIQYLQIVGSRCSNVQDWIISPKNISRIVNITEQQFASCESVTQVLDVTYTNLVHQFAFCEAVTEVLNVTYTNLVHQFASYDAVTKGLGVTYTNLVHQFASCDAVT
jgi:hypothetical protein